MSIFVCVCGGGGGWDGWEWVCACACLLRRRASARNVSSTPYPTSDKHTISTLLIKPIFSVLARAEKQFFSKLVFKCLCACELRALAGVRALNCACTCVCDVGWCK